MGLISKNLSTVTQAFTSPASFLQSKLSGGAIGGLLAQTSIGTTVTEAASGLIRQATSSAASVLNSIDLSSVAGNVAGSLKEMFGKTTDSVMADVKTAVPDAFAASFKAAPQAGTFLTSKLNSEMSTLEFGAAAKMAANELSKVDLSNLAASATRLGIPLPSSDQALGELKKAAGDALKDSSLTGLFSGLGGISETLAPIGEAVSSVRGSASAVLGDLNGFLQTNVSKFPGVAGIDGTLASHFTAGLPRCADSTGHAITGIPTNTDTTFLSGLTNLAKGVGVDTSPWAGATNYSVQQNTFNAGFGMAAENGLGSVVSSFAQNAQYNGTTKALASSLIPAIAGKGNADMVNQLVGLVGGNKVGGKQSLIQTLINNPNLAESAVGAVGGVMEKLGVDVSDIFGTGDKIGDTIIWNAPAIQNANQTVTKVMLPDAVTKLTSGAKTTFPDGTIVNWRS